jgi:2-polyprenyl-3-methyl-5-hydroxy-6-metoxy-1,4-benzoquinol methylase
MQPYMNMENEKIYNYVKKKTKFYKDLFNEYINIDLTKSNILDIGSGTGIISFIFSPLVKSVIGLDPSKKMIDVANNSKKIYNTDNVVFIKGTLDDTCLDQKFDIIIFSNILHLYPNLLRKSINLLNKNGIIYIKHPTKKSTFADTRLRPESPDFIKDEYDKYMLNIHNVKNKIYKYIRQNNLVLVYKIKDNSLHLFIKNSID